MEENLNITLKPEQIRFTGSGIKIKDSLRGRYKIPYKELITASVEVYDEDSGIYYEPEITDITEEMEGDLLLYNNQHHLWRIRTERLNKPAGSLLAELVRYAPYIMVGRQTWLDLEDAAAFAEAGSMVELMRQCR